MSWFPDGTIWKKDLCPAFYAQYSETARIASDTVLFLVLFLSYNSVNGQFYVKRLIDTYRVFGVLFVDNVFLCRLEG